MDISILQQKLLKQTRDNKRKITKQGSVSNSTIIKLSKEMLKPKTKLCHI